MPQPFIGSSNVCGLMRILVSRPKAEVALRPSRSCVESLLESHIQVMK